MGDAAAPAALGTRLAAAQSASLGPGLPAGGGEPGLTPGDGRQWRALFPGSGLVSLRSLCGRKGESKHGGHSSGVSRWESC